jgi:hypothetical protein
VAVDFIASLTLVFTVIAALAAVVAAFYAKGSGAKTDLERVERNISERIEAVRAHLEEQHRREAQRALVDRASMAVEARGPAGEPLVLRFTLDDAGMELLRVDLLNADSMQSGSFSCTPMQPLASRQRSITIHYATGLGQETKQVTGNESRFARIYALTVKRPVESCGPT